VECYLRDLPRQEQAHIARLVSSKRPKDAKYDSACLFRRVLRAELIDQRQPNVA